MVFEADLKTATRKVLMLCLADKANKDGTGCWPSQRTIARETHLDRKTVRKLLKELVDEGFLIQRGVNKVTKTETYDISLKMLVEAQDVVGVGENSPMSEGVGENSPEVGENSPVGGGMVVPKPSLTINKTARARAGAPWMGSLRDALEPKATTEHEARRLNQLLDEALGFDGRRVLVVSAYAKDTYSNDLSKVLKAANLVLTYQKADMRMEEDA
jgi:biotin operon repressor